MPPHLAPRIALLPPMLDVLQPPLAWPEHVGMSIADAWRTRLALVAQLEVLVVDPLGAHGAPSGGYTLDRAVNISDLIHDACQATYILQSDLRVGADLQLNAVLLAHNTPIFSWLGEATRDELFALLNRATRALHGHLHLEPSAHELATPQVETSSFDAFYYVAIAKGVDPGGEPLLVSRQLAWLEKALEADPNYATAMRACAQVLLDNGRAQDTCTFLEHLGVAWEDALRDLHARAAWHAGHLDDACHHANLWAAQRPFDLDAHLLLADVLLAAGRDDEAAFHLQLIRPRWPAQPHLDRRLAKALRHHDPQRSLTLYSAQLQAQPNDPELLLEHAHTLVKAGHLTEAEAAFRRTIEHAPTVDALQGFAALLRLTQRPAQSCAYLLRAQRQRPDDPTLRTDLAWSLALVEDIATARTLAASLPDDVNHHPATLATRLELALHDGHLARVMRLLPPVLDHPALRPFTTAWQVEAALRADDLDAAAAPLADASPLAQAWTTDRLAALRARFHQQRDWALLDTLARFAMTRQPDDAQARQFAAHVAFSRGEHDLVAGRLRPLLDASIVPLDAALLHLMLGAHPSEQHRRFEALAPRLRPVDAALLQAWLATQHHADASFTAALRVLCNPATAVGHTDVRWLSQWLVRHPARHAPTVDVLADVSDPTVRRVMAPVLQLCGDDARALTWLRDACEDAPDDVPTRCLLGMLLDQRGEHTLAHAHWAHALRVAPDDPEVVLLNSVPWLLAHRTLDALVLIETARQRAPGDGRLREALHAVLAMIQNAS